MLGKYGIMIGFLANAMLFCDRNTKYWKPDCFPKRQVYDSEAVPKAGEIKPPEAPRAEVSDTPTESKVEELKIEVQDRGHIDAIARKLKEHPENLTEDEKNTIRAILRLDVARNPPQKDEDFKTWCGRVVHAPQFQHFLIALDEKRETLLRVTGETWENLKFAGQTVASSARQGIESAASSAKETLSQFLDWAKKNPMLAIPAVLAGAYGIYRVAGRLFGQASGEKMGWFEKGIMIAGGTFLLGRTLSHDGVKNWIRQTFGIEVDDYRVTKALQHLGSLDFRKATAVLLGVNPDEVSSRELQRMSRSLEQWVLREDGMADAIFGKEAFDPGMERTLLYLQTIVPPRIDPKKKIKSNNPQEQLSPQERLLVIRETLWNPNRAAQDKIKGKKYSEISPDDKTALQDFDLIFEEYDRMSEQVDQASDSVILNFFSGIKGLGDFSSVLGSLQDNQRAQMASGLRQSIKQYWSNYKSLKDNWQLWKQGDTPEYEFLKSETALQIVELQEVFSKYTKGIVNLQSKEARDKLWQIPAAFLGAGLAYGGGFTAIMIAGGALALSCKAALFGIKGAVAVAGSVGWIALPVLIVAGGLGYEAWRGEKARAERNHRSPESWQALAREKASDEKDYIHWLYDAVYKSTTDWDESMLGVAKEFFGFDPKNKQQGEYEIIRFTILSAALRSKLDIPPFPETKESESMKRLLIRNAEDYLRKNYEEKGYRLESPGEAETWVSEALRYAHFIVNEKDTQQEALRKMSEATQTQGERILRPEFQESLGRSVNPLERALQEMQRTNPRAAAALAGDLKLLYQLGIRSETRKALDRKKYGEADVARFQAEAHLAQDYAMNGTMTGGRAGQEQWQRGKLEADQVARGVAEVEVGGDRETPSEELWDVDYFNTQKDRYRAELARMRIFLKLYNDPSVDKTLLGMASEATSRIKEMFLKYSDTAMSDIAFSKPWKKYTGAIAEYVKLDLCYNNIHVIWEIFEDLIREMKNKPPDEQKRISKEFFERSMAISSDISNYFAETYSIKKGKIKKIKDEIMKTSQEKMLPEGEDVTDNLNLLKEKSQQYLTDAKLDLSPQLKKNGNVITVENNSLSSEIVISQERISIGKLNFPHSNDGMVKAIMSAAIMNNFLEKFKNEIKNVQREDKQYFVFHTYDKGALRDNGIYWFDSGALTLSFLRQELVLYITNQENAFLDTLNDAASRIR